jgi:hypothetical protein
MYAEAVAKQNFQPSDEDSFLNTKVPLLVILPAPSADHCPLVIVTVTPLLIVTVSPAVSAVGSVTLVE